MSSGPTWPVSTHSSESLVNSHRIFHTHVSSIAGSSPSERAEVRGPIRVGWQVPKYRLQRPPATTSAVCGFGSTRT